MKKKISFFLTLIMVLSMVQVQSNPMTVDVTYDGWYLNGEDGFVMKVLESSLNGTDGIPIYVRSQTTDTEFEVYINAGENMGFGMPKDVPDWATDESQFMLIGGLFEGGEFEVNYSAPWSIPVASASDDGPLFFHPIIPIGDDTYWNTIMDSFSANGFSTELNTTHLSVTFSNSSHNIAFDYERATGLFDYYYFWSDVDSTVTVIELKQEFLLDPSHSSVLEWGAEMPVMDYRVLYAGYANGTEGLYLDGGSDDQTGTYDDRDPSEPIEAEGYFYSGELMQANLWDFVPVSEGAGYMLELQTDSGRVLFNISINLPSVNPYNNTLYVYPMFPLADTSLINAYFGMTTLLGENYSHSISGNHITINYDDGSFTLTATWDYTTGFLQYWKMYNSDSSQGGILELDLIAAADVAAMDVGYDATIGEGHTYIASHVQNGTQTQIDLETGYIGAGDYMYWEVIDIPPLFGSDEGDGGPRIYYDLIADNGHEDNISLTMPYPADPRFDGPPFFMIHMLTGNTIFYDWATTLFAEIGASFTTNSTHINLQWTPSFGGASEDGVIDISWRLSDGVLQYYYVYVPSIEGGPEFILEAIYVGEGNLLGGSSPSDETTGGISLPIFAGDTLYFFIATVAMIPILRKR